MPRKVEQESPLRQVGRRALGFRRSIAPFSLRSKGSITRRNPSAEKKTKEILLSESLIAQSEGLFAQCETLLAPRQSLVQRLKRALIWGWSLPRSASASALRCCTAW